MNRKMVFYTVGYIVTAEAALLLLPLLVALLYGESCALSFLITIGISLAVGLGMVALCRKRDSLIYAREGFAIVALAWIVVSAIGALPFTISGEIPNYVDALFETVSGFTTTGASIVPDVEAMSHGILFWRSFTHWVGGMGVLVFVMAIIPSMSDRSIHIMRAEMPGPVVGKLVPRSRETAGILYRIYVVMTLILIVLLRVGGMNWFESVVHAFGTAGTGGFGVRADSIAGYSPYLQWVITVFMILFGVNFNLYYLLLIRRFRSVLQSTELWFYLGLVIVSAGLIAVNIYPIYGSASDAARHGFFQVASIMSTTGYATANFDLWPQFSRGLIFILLFVGACAGSTCGGFKISRVVILLKMIRKEVRFMIRPRSVNSVRMEGKTVDPVTLNSIGTYFAIYALCMLVTFLLLSLEPFSLETNLTAAVTCFNNVGPGLAGVGPASNFAAYSPYSKLLLSFAMLLGRLEIYPLLIAMHPGNWFRK